MNLLIAISSCMQHFERRKAIRETWMPRNGVMAAFFIGAVPATPPDQVVMLPCEDTYEALPFKTLAIMRHSMASYSFDWLFKCDDDTYADSASLLAAARALKGDYAGLLYHGDGK